MTEFTFGDETYIPGDFVKIQTIEQNHCNGFIKSIESKQIGEITIQMITVESADGEQWISTGEIEFMKGTR
jgi:hypothetical protein